ncbi:Uncharacterized protein involved in cysteine biosynthesis [Nitrosomonas cryotolerans]|uniref:Uncharacterized protein involved in cysteine biosynthesis n=1 Tax=Nitrosomonas cryotolerans ATCC 49181 TaxID=1131553 RepID=A0A1N6IMQ1_9PROT|nr:EI24 domain-containing protein [Nitrosomonas cryotolerans]SFP36469.1 Uncharacterized protein involved in cysteine biosynthesis [Nitrosomonas cryotolerans]SIO33257.1 Uncharacterized protein involved in cysteine biosynthesis [Nitrosomonas cryotolerans ATCC 49181]
MSHIFSALLRALGDLFQPKVLWIMVWPVLVAGSLWLVLSVIFWDIFSGWVTQGFSNLGIQSWLGALEPEWIVHGIQSITHMILFISLVTVTTLFITAIFAMPALINVVANRHYPSLKREYGGSIRGSLINALLAMSIFALMWLITLPLWLIGLGIIVPFVAAAYLNQQLFRYDALSEHASHEEMRVLLATHQLSLWSLGLLTGMVQFVPFLNLFAPVFAALAFIHFELARLMNMRPPSDIAA